MRGERKDISKTKKNSQKFQYPLSPVDAIALSLGERSMDIGRRQKVLLHLRELFTRNLRRYFGELGQQKTEDVRYDYYTAAILGIP